MGFRFTPRISDRFDEIAERYRDEVFDVDRIREQVRQDLKEGVKPEYALSRIPYSVLQRQLRASAKEQIRNGGFNHLTNKKRNVENGLYRVELLVRFPCGFAFDPEKSVYNQRGKYSEKRVPYKINAADKQLIGIIHGTFPDFDISKGFEERSHDYYGVGQLIEEPFLRMFYGGGISRPKRDKVSASVVDRADVHQSLRDANYGEAVKIMLSSIDNSLGNKKAYKIVA